LGGGWRTEGRGGLEVSFRGEGRTKKRHGPSTQKVELLEFILAEIRRESPCQKTPAGSTKERV